MSKVLAVAWRDFKYTALTKTFLLAAIAMPLLAFGSIFAIGVLFRPNVAPLTGAIAIIDSDGRVAEAAQIELSPQRVRKRVSSMMEKFGERAASAKTAAAGPDAGGVQVLQEGLDAASLQAALPLLNLSVQRFDSNADAAALKDKVRSGEFKALAIVPDAVVEVSHQPSDETGEPAGPHAVIDLYVPANFAPNHTRLIQGVLRDAVVRARVERMGQSFEEVESLMARPELSPMRLGGHGSEERESIEAKMFIPIAFMMLLWITTFTSGNYLLTSTIEEKSNKVMEVLLSAVSPMQLMTGKILGQAGVSVLMMILYAGLGISGLTVAAMFNIINPVHLLYLGLFFVMAYFMVASIMAGVGSAVSDLRDAQSLITPAMIVLMIPLLLWLPISENPNGVLATVSSFIPPLIPFVMILRVTAASEPVALWQIIASLIVGYASMIGMVWMCAKIFRIGVLMYGKPPSPVELLRWLRYS